MSFHIIDNELKNIWKEIVQTHFGAPSRIVRNEKIAELVQSALTEYSTKNQPYKEQVLETKVELLIVTLIRSFLNVQTTMANVSDSEILCFKLMNYIDTHVYSLQRLEDIAPKFNYSYGYLSGLFKRTTGKNLSEYYLNKKMETAKALIIERKRKLAKLRNPCTILPIRLAKRLSLDRAFRPKLCKPSTKNRNFFEIFF